MRALTFHGVEQVRVETVPDPHLRAAGDAIVRVRWSAICGSDLHVYHGREIGLDVGTVMGHEFVGDVVEVGREVRRLSVGEPVVSPFTTCCGDCYYCRRGLTARCERGQLFGWVQEGAGLHGAQAEYVRVPLADSSLVGLRGEDPLEEVLFAGDILSTGYFCADLAEVRAGQVVVVLGCGPVGLMAVVGALEMAADRVIAVDAVPQRLALAEQFGAVAVDFGRQDAVEAVHEATSGRGADAVLEAVGSAEATRLAVDLVRPGGTIAAVGVHTESGFAFSPVEAYDKNLTYRAGRCSARHYMVRLLPLIRSGKYPLASVVSHRLPLEDGPRGYEMFSKRSDGCIKVLLAADRELIARP